MDAASSYAWHEAQARSDCTTGSDAMREDRWRTVDAILVELRGEAERWAAANAHRITAFAELLFATDGQRLTGEPLREALRSALADQ